MYVTMIYIYIYLGSSFKALLLLKYPLLCCGVISNLRHFMHFGVSVLAFYVASQQNFARRTRKLEHVVSASFRAPLFTGQKP